MKIKNNLKKIITMFCMFVLILCGCENAQISYTPTNLTVASSEVKVIVNSIRDLNDIVTLRFEPKETTQRDVVWSTEENEIFSLSGSTITATKIGKAKVTATSVVNQELSTDVTISVYDPNLTSYNVSYISSEDFSISKIEKSYYEGEKVEFVIDVLNDNKEIELVKANENILEPNDDNKYSFIMPGSNVIINVSLKNIETNPDENPSDEPSDAPIVESSIAYEINFDLGTYKTARRLETKDAVFATFKSSIENINIITSIGEFDYIYGGGNGGRGDTAWYVGNMLKFGTTSVNGYITLALNVEVKGVKITGYVSDSTCKIRVGDASSSDWGEETMDNKTKLITCTDMMETTKDVVENNQVSTVEIDFESTRNLKISTTNKKPLYITSIEFLIA